MIRFIIAAIFIVAGILYLQRQHLVYLNLSMFFKPYACGGQM